MSVSLNANQKTKTDKKKEKDEIINLEGLKALKNLEI
jgi:hypothetical protein